MQPRLGRIHVPRCGCPSCPPDVPAQVAETRDNVPMTADKWEPESFDPGLRLRAMRVLDDDAVEFDFEGINAPDERFVAKRSWHRGLELWNLDERFQNRYRAVPGPRAGSGLEALGALFLRVRGGELPVGSAYEALAADVRARAAARFAEISAPSDAAPPTVE